MTLPEEVPNEDTSLYLFALAAETCDGADIIGDHHESCPSQILLGCLTGSLLNVHLAEAAGHDVSRQAESVVVTTVNIFHWKYEGMSKLTICGNTFKTDPTYQLSYCLRWPLTPELLQMFCI